MIRQLDLQPVAGTDGDLLAALQAASLPTDDLIESGRSFFQLSDHGRKLGFGGRRFTISTLSCARWSWFRNIVGMVMARL
jgi:hypothetical protein